MGDDSDRELGYSDKRDLSSQRDRDDCCTGSVKKRHKRSGASTCCEGKAVPCCDGKKPAARLIMSFFDCSSFVR